MSDTPRTPQLTDAALRDLWRDLAEKNIEHGTDWPFIARTLFRDIDRLRAASTVQADDGQACLNLLPHHHPGECVRLDASPAPTNGADHE